MLDITTQGMIGLTGSDTSACSGKLSSGSRTPAICMTTELWPAADTPMRRLSIAPRVVSTPAIAPFASRRNPVTSQFSMMSTPSAFAARA